MVPTNFDTRDLSSKHKKLNQGPLSEVVFELLWELPRDQTGFPFDEGFSLAQGIISQNVAKLGFEVHTNIAPVPNLRIHPRLVHQFWKGELTWPVIQIGEGILAVNDVNATYEWYNGYLSTVNDAINAVERSYANKLKFNKCSLRYINSTELPLGESYESFIEKRFRIRVVNDFQNEGQFLGLNINQTFRLDDGSSLSFAIQTVINSQNDHPALIWTLSSEKLGTVDAKELDRWLDYSHKHISDLFVNSLTATFYDTFHKL